MGGKNKPNRTKNNVRPSSSARSAELLGNQAPTFFGVASLKGSLSMVPGVPTVTDEIDGNIDANYQIVLKKMVKKDPTTKVKALKEFTEMCDKAEPEEVKTILPFWPRLYCQLCGDTEHRVREAAHQAHKAVVSKVKKSLAPYLKEIIGPWFTSQYDNYPPAASAAVSAFQEAFSPSKMVEAVNYCQEEILNYIIQNVTVHTPQTLSNPKTSTAEEIAAKYQRVIISSFMGYALYLEKITQEQLTAKKDTNKVLVSSAKFWKFAQNKDPIIRHSFYTALIALFQHGNFLLVGEITRVVGAILNNLNENDPLVTPVVWNAALHGPVSIKECWAQPNVEKQLLPKLFNIFRNGGNGYGCAIFPNILPFLSQIPEKIIGNKSDFFDKLFGSMRAGLEISSVNRSQSESRVVAETFIECLKYIVMLNIEDPTLVSRIVIDHLIGAVRSCIENSVPPQLTKAPFTYQVSQLLRSWHRSETNYDAVTEIFWSELNKLFDEQLDKALCQEDIVNTLKSQVEFMKLLKMPSKYVPKNARERVKFASVEIEEEKITYAEDPTPEYDANCLNCAKKLSESYYDNFHASNSHHYLKGMLGLAKYFDSYSILGFVINDATLAERKLPRDLLIELSAEILPHVPEKEQERFLVDLSDTGDDALLNLCRGVLQSLTPAVRNWLQGPQFTSMYLRFLNQYLTSEEESTDDDVLKQFMEPDTLLSMSAMGEVMKTFISCVTNPSFHYFDRLFRIGSSWPGKLCDHPYFNDFIVALFGASCGSEIKPFVQLLRSLLTKFKYHRSIEPDVWQCLFKTMAADIKPSIGNVDRVVDVILQILEIACDVDLTETCDSGEIQDVTPLLTIFMEQSKAVIQGRCVILKLCQECSEADGHLPLRYFQLKSNEIFQAADCVESKEIISYRNSLKSTLNDDFDNFNSLLVAMKYIQWLHLASSLINRLLQAYPRKTKIDDIRSGRYSGSPCQAILDSTENDVIPKVLTSEEWQILLQEEQIFLSLLEDEDYPDVNLIGTLSNVSLNIIEGAAALKCLLSVAANDDFIASFSTHSSRLHGVVREIVENATPAEFKFLRSLCETLVIEEPLWYIHQDYLTGVFSRKFSAENAFTEETIISMVNKVLEEKLGGTSTNVHLLTTVVNDYCSYLKIEHWNQIFIQLDNALKKISATSEFKEKGLIEIGAISSFYLIAYNKLKSNNEDENCEKFDEELAKMWKDVVNYELWSQLLALWERLAISVAPKTDQEEPEAWLKEPRLSVPLRKFCEAININLKDQHREINVTMDKITSLTSVCIRLLISRVMPLQLTAFNILKVSFVRDIIKEDMGMLENELATGEGNLSLDSSSLKISALHSTLMDTQIIVEALLSDLKMGDICAVQPFTDSFTYTQGFLLIWCIIAEACSQAEETLRCQYALWLKQNGFLASFINFVFKLMPADVVHGDDAHDTSALFEKCDIETLNASATCRWVEHRACYVFRMILQWLPVAVRDWSNEVDHYISTMVSRIVKTHVTPILVNCELMAVLLKAPSNFKSLSLFANTPARELTASYEVDEAVMQIVFTLPPNYPLAPVKVDVAPVSGNSRASRISLFLTHRNGSIMDALNLWKSDLDKKFEGLDECAICFSLFHGSNMEIPKQACRTCRKKFHSACLYKWFSTSNKSSCPHCATLY